MRTGKVVVGLLAGVAIGALAGILFAPDKGSKTRKQLVDKGEDLVDDLKSKLDGMLNSVTEKFEQVQSQADAFVEKGKAKYAEAKKEVNHTA
ncbi:MAG: YtxH domain-containing protein [Bacteroidetes bacterium]|nr:YtxH domain-containing protein [Bacteroidota bacterium]MBK9671654.1 YtxH domain-containing protein [Bacteroidota bacterium]MBK9800546.1 YtxH domain-containing protein [Bacteroidota bacterium]MBP6412119.1 YtxH domain-containing protein [Bacteroidia bacterium]